jgi:uncharacterized RDD family membrane protein YckC
MSIVAQTVQAPARVLVVGFWRRMAAGFVDGAILSAVFALLGSLAALVTGHPLPRLSQLGPDYLVDLAVNGSVAAEAGLVMAAILGLLYFFIFHTLRGQTPGKRLCRVRVIDGFGEPPSPARALIRTLAYVPSLLCLCLGFLWIGFDREKRGLHDWLADTYVISVDGSAP